ncbi:hypothetical protein [Chitinophaga sp. ARDCPP14]|uniref:hypothetical protein n=1 Tax=Chitinophaga sp. ARDCPP14 TaxID=3391139 RepID=UPI003F520AC2
MPDTVFFHEDYYKQIELVPEQNYFKAIIDIENLPSKDENKYGFPNAIVRDEHLIKLGDLKISFNQFYDLLSPIAINYFSKVTTGYNNNIQTKENTVAFGFERLGIFVSFEAEFVTNIWLCLSQLFAQTQNCQKILSALNILGTTYKLALIDWDEEIIIRLSNYKSSEEYLMDTFGFMIPDK